MAKLELKGMEEFMEKIKLIEERAPDRILDKLDEEGEKLKCAMKENAPKRKRRRRKCKSKKITKLTKKKKNIKIRNRFKSNETIKRNDVYQKEIYNNAPQHHLVNNGHRKVTKLGKEIGFTEGLFYVEKTMSQEEEKIKTSLEKWLDELYKELR